MYTDPAHRQDVKTTELQKRNSLYVHDLYDLLSRSVFFWGGGVKTGLLDLKWSKYYSCPSELIGFYIVNIHRPCIFVFSPGVTLSSFCFFAPNRLLILWGEAYRERPSIA